VGVEVTAVERTKSASSYNELRFGQLATVEQTQNSFIFLITGQEHLLYGVCVINTELINECPSFIGQSIGPTTRNVVELFAPRCYCIISRFPFFRLHLEVLYRIIARERLFKLLHDVDMEGGGGAAIASDVHSADDIIRAYHEKQCPTETDNLTFHLPGELRSIEFVCPPGDEDKQLADWGILTQLQLLSMENVVTLFKAVMLEKQIVIVSSNPGLLSAVVLSIIPIFRPYVFQGPFIPILPVVLYEYLEAPVPYIIGLLRLPEENSQNSVLSDKIVVDIDNNTIKLPTSKDFLFPKLPREKKFLEKLLTIQKELQIKIPKGSHLQRNPRNNLSAEQPEMTTSIVHSFKKYQAWMMDDIIIKAAKSLEGIEIDTDEKRINFLKSVDSSYRDFMGLFLASQHFSVYTEKLVEIAEKRGTILRSSSLEVMERGRNSEVRNTF